MSESDSEQLKKKFPSFLEFLNEGRRKDLTNWILRMESSLMMSEIRPRIRGFAP